jgi:hypothetical protein
MRKYNMICNSFFCILVTTRAFHEPSSGEADQASGDGERRDLLVTDSHSEQQSNNGNQKSGTRCTSRTEPASGGGHQDVGDRGPKGAQREEG